MPCYMSVRICAHRSRCGAFGEILIRIALIRCVGLILPISSLTLSAGLSRRAGFSAYALCAGRAAYALRAARTVSMFSPRLKPRAPRKASDKARGATKKSKILEFQPLAKVNERISHESNQFPCRHIAISHVTQNRYSILFLRPKNDTKIGSILGLVSKPICRYGEYPDTPKFGCWLNVFGPKTRPPGGLKNGPRPSVTRSSHWVLC